MRWCVQTTTAVGTVVNSCAYFAGFGAQDGCLNVLDVFYSNYGTDVSLQVRRVWSRSCLMVGRAQIGDNLPILGTGATVGYFWTYGYFDTGRTRFACFTEATNDVSVFDECEYTFLDQFTKEECQDLGFQDPEDMDIVSEYSAKDVFAWSGGTVVDCEANYNDKCDCIYCKWWDYCPKPEHTLTQRLITDNYDFPWGKLPTEGEVAVLFPEDTFGEGAQVTESPSDGTHPRSGGTRIYYAAPHATCSLFLAFVAMYVLRS